MVIALAALTLMAIGACGGSDGEGGGDSAAVRATATPAATPNPLATPPVDWRQFKVDAASIWLPPRFEGGPLGDQAATTFGTIAALGAGCAAVADAFGNPAPTTRFLAVDRNDCGGTGVMTLVILVLPRQGFSASAITEELAKQTSDTLLVRGSDVIALGGRDVGRIVQDGRRDSPGRGQGVQYVLTSGDEYFALAFTTSSGIDGLLPETERIVRTLEDSLPDE